jgi:hypothetical protein
MALDGACSLSGFPMILLFLVLSSVYWYHLYHYRRFQVRVQEIREPWNQLKTLASILDLCTDIVDESTFAGTANGDDVCSICLDPIRGSGEIRVIRNCGHAYHGSCIDPWFSSFTSDYTELKTLKCPLCRQRLRPADATAV